MGTWQHGWTMSWSVLLQLGFNHQELRSYTLQRYLVESKVRDCVRICTESAKLFGLMDCKMGLNKIVWVSHTCAQSIRNSLHEEQCYEIFENKTNKLPHESNKSQAWNKWKVRQTPRDFRNLLKCWLPRQEQSRRLILQGFPQAGAIAWWQSTCLAREALGSISSTVQTSIVLPLAGLPFSSKARDSESKRTTSKGNPRGCLLGLVQRRDSRVWGRHSLIWFCFSEYNKWYFCLTRNYLTDKTLNLKYWPVHTGIRKSRRYICKYEEERNLHWYPGVLEDEGGSLKTDDSQGCWCSSEVQHWPTTHKALSQTIKNK